MALDFLSPLHKASRQIKLYLESLTREVGVSPIEGHLLTYLHSYAPAPISELVQVFGIKQSTFTSMIDRLENAGLIRREINPDDRRSFLIHITDEGRSVATRINEFLTTFEQEVREQIDARDLEGYHAVMEAIESVTQVQLRER